MNMLPSTLPLRTSGVMTTAELAAWAQIGKNAVPGLVSRFGIREISGHAKSQRYSVHDVMRSILGISPATPDDLERLLVPLQKATWVASVTGLSTSSINANACENRGALPAPVELTVTKVDHAAARGRRWVPAQIDAHLRGIAIPYQRRRISLKKPAAQTAHPSVRNVFAELCASNAEVSRQCQS